MDQTTTPNLTQPNSTPLPPPPLSSSNQTGIKIIIIGLIVLMIIGIGFITLKLINQRKSTIATPAGTTINPFVKKQSEQEILASQIKIDSDSDSIPDFIETVVKLDPKISEFTRCKGDVCIKSDKSTLSAKNTLFIIDASGSMAQDMGGGSKMDMAKQAIGNFIATGPKNESIGIMIYGNKGSNSANDKAVSCASAEVVAPLGAVTSSSIGGYLDTISPVGWTPIGLAIEKGMGAFAGKEGQRNQIVIVSDGNETCNTDPATKAALAFASPLKIQVNVIGFSVASSEYDALTAISTQGGGSFMTANSSSELEAQFENNGKNFDTFQADAQCISKASEAEYKCLQEVSDKVRDYLHPIIQKSINNGPFYTLYTDLNSSINGVYGDTITALLDSWGKQVDERKSTLLNQ